MFGNGIRIASLCLLQIAIGTSTIHGDKTMFQASSRGSDCNCQCILQSNQGAFCPGSNTKRRTVYTMRSAPSGDECKCICTAPPPSGCDEKDESTEKTDERFSKLVSALVSIERIISRKTEDGIMLKKAIASLVEMEQDLSSDNLQEVTQSEQTKKQAARVINQESSDVDGRGSGENTAFLDDEDDVLIDEMPLVGKPAPLVVTQAQKAQPHVVIQLPNKIIGSNTAGSTGRVYSSGGEYYFKTHFRTSSRFSVIKPALSHVVPVASTISTTVATTSSTAAPPTKLATTTEKSTLKTTTPTTSQETTTAQLTTIPITSTILPTTPGLEVTMASSTTIPYVPSTVPTTKSTTSKALQTRQSLNPTSTSRTTLSTKPVITTPKLDEDLYYYEYYYDEPPTETITLAATKPPSRNEVIVPKLTAVFNELYRDKDKNKDKTETLVDVESFEESYEIDPLLPGLEDAQRGDAEHSVSFHNTNMISSRVDRHSVDRKKEAAEAYEDYYNDDYYSDIYYYKNDEALDVSTTTKATTTTTTTATTTTNTPHIGTCGTLAYLSSPKMIFQFGRREGAWMKDAVASRTDQSRNEKIYYANFYYGNNLLEFDNLEKLKNMQWSNSYVLPNKWIGTGHVVYNGSLYYNQAFTKSLVKYNLKDRFISAWKHLNDATYDSNAPYSWRGHSMVHATADEEGLWVLYPSDDPRDPYAPLRYVIHKIDPLDLRTIQSFRSGISTDRYNTATGRITRAYDTRSRRSTSLYLPFQNKFSYTVQMLYNPRDRKIYAWDNGKQLQYDVNMVF